MLHTAQLCIYVYVMLAMQYIVV